MVMFNEIGRIHQWNDGIDGNDEFIKNWIPSKDQLPETVACIVDCAQTISSCEYRQGISTVTIPLLQSKMDITLEMHIQVPFLLQQPSKVNFRNAPFRSPLALSQLEEPL